MISCMSTSGWMLCESEPTRRVTGEGEVTTSRSLE